jgi:hypothetical protein
MSTWRSVILLLSLLASAEFLLANDRTGNNSNQEIYSEIARDARSFLNSSLRQQQQQHYNEASSNWLSDYNSLASSSRLAINSDHELLLDSNYSNYSMHKMRTKRFLDSYQSKPLAECCRRVSFNVKFKELGWDKWILYPKMFDAHLCEGDCALPLKRMRKRVWIHGTGKGQRSVAAARAKVATSVTNHAQIMSILEFKHPEASGKMTKCVSTKLKPLTVIYLNEQGQVKSKQYEDMVVDECGCR